MSHLGGLRLGAEAVLGERHPCSGCGFMMRGGPTCGDCIEYGPPRDWRWRYDAQSSKHTKVALTAATAQRSHQDVDSSVVVQPGERE